MILEMLLCRTLRDFVYDHITIAILIIFSGLTLIASIFQFLKCCVLFYKILLAIWKIMPVTKAIKLICSIFVNQTMHSFVKYYFYYVTHVSYQDIFYLQ